MQELIAQAKAAIANSYFPYSQFKVAAAIKAADGRIFTGVNVENASYGLTQCAERAAITAAVSAGVRQIDAVVTYTPTQEPAAPCGACRQVIREFSGSALILSICDSEKTLELSIADLLPESFQFEQGKST